jgi:hypothetical protein
MITSGPMGFAPAGITAFHGSPYLFRQFDTSKIGSGEGAQAYGTGAGYTAESRGVAETYAQANRGRAAALSGEIDKLPKPAQMGVFKALNRPEGFIKQAEILDITKRYPETAPLFETSKSYLYKGDIPDEILPKFLDWDKPLGQQSKEVKQAAKNVWEQVKGNSAFKGKTFDDFLSESGESLYLRLGAGKEGKQADLAATNFLESDGVKGIRYLDQESRGKYKAQTTYKGEPYSDVLTFYDKKQLDDFVKEKEAEGFGVKTFPQTSNFIPFRAEDYKIQEINDTPIEDYIAKGLL